MRRVSVSVANAVPICKKELRRYFASPIGYVLLFGSALLAGLSLSVSEPAVLMRPIFDLSRFSPSRELVLEHTRVALLVGLARTVVLLLVPMITMRLFIEERRSRTVEMLFTSPIHDHEI